MGFPELIRRRETEKSLRAGKGRRALSYKSVAAIAGEMNAAGVVCSN